MIDHVGSQALTDLIKQLQETVMNVRTMRMDYTEQYSEVQKLRKQISQLQQTIISMIENIKNNYTERKKLLENILAEMQTTIDSLPNNERVYGQLQRKFTINEKIYSYLLEKRATTMIAEASTINKNWINLINTL